jgi:hypothetical protein
MWKAQLLKTNRREVISLAVPKRLMILGDRTPNYFFNK